MTDCPKPRLLIVLLACITALTALRGQPVFSNAVSRGTVNFNALHQASGVVASRNNEGVLWTHNDAGDSARIFAIATNGNYLGTFVLTNGTHVDYEDIAIGPGPLTNVQYLYVGDIGDNNSSRSNVVVYQIPEPAAYLHWATNSVSLDLQGVRPITLYYPDGPHNAETLLVDPVAGDLFIATKQSGVARIYTASKAQLNAGGTNNLSFVREITFDSASGGDISPTGGEIVIRQEDFAQLWVRAPGQSVSNALGGTPVSIPVVGRTNEPNGEAIGFDAIGRGYYTLSDSASTQPLYYFDRLSPYPVQPRASIVDAGSTWRYLDTGTNLGSAWRTNGFNDSTWNAGNGQFGYGDGDEETTVSFGSKSKNKYVTTYFRKKFVVTNAATIGALELKLVYDDGAAVFLNGTQIVLVNLTNGAVYNSLATNTQSALQSTWITFSISPALLANGTNLLAVEVHQAATNSPDLSFDAQLIAYQTPAAPPPPQIISKMWLSNGGFAFTFTSVATSVNVESSTNLPSWFPLGSATATNGLGAFVDLTATNRARRFYRLH